MTQNPDDFSNLQRLLRWKRYEQPPPRYFDNFSTGIIVQIERINEVNQDPCLGTLVSKLRSQTHLVCAYGLAVGGTPVVRLQLFWNGRGEFTKFFRCSRHVVSWWQFLPPLFHQERSFLAWEVSPSLRGTLPLVPDRRRGRTARIPL